MSVGETIVGQLLERLEWSALDEAQRRRALARPVQAVEDAVRATVAGLIEEVRNGGPEALRAITRRLDGVVLEDLEVGAA